MAEAHFQHSSSAAVADSGITSAQRRPPTVNPQSASATLTWGTACPPATVEVQPADVQALPDTTPAQPASADSPRTGAQASSAFTATQAAPSQSQHSAAESPQDAAAQPDSSRAAVEVSATDADQQVGCSREGQHAGQGMSGSAAEHTSGAAEQEDLRGTLSRQLQVHLAWPCACLGAECMHPRCALLQQQRRHQHD